MGEYGLEDASLTIDSLLPFEVHTVSMRSLNRKGWSEWADPITFKTKPSMANPPQVSASVAVPRGPARLAPSCPQNALHTPYCAMRPGICHCIGCMEAPLYQVLESLCEIERGPRMNDNVLIA